MISDTELNEIELLSCPICNGTRLKLIENRYNRYNIECGSCGYYDGEYHTLNDAIVSWNTRYPYIKICKYIDHKNRCAGNGLEYIFECKDNNNES